MSRVEEPSTVTPDTNLGPPHICAHMFVSTHTYMRAHPQANIQRDRHECHTHENEKRKKHVHIVPSFFSILTRRN